mmetsp:Transcript_27073/g.72919  ORF Transcript_27073/g.72919 Transcript_27073/m.72919 type:complete len:1138 (+) Transcript_27073:380-3793(+)
MATSMEAQVEGCGLYTKLHLRVTAHTAHGQSIRVSGSSITMGRHNTTEALPLVTTPAEYPVWRTPKPILIPRGQTHSYSYALFSGNEIMNWEDLEPRVLKASRQTITTSDEFGVATGVPKNLEGKFMGTSPGGSLVFDQKSGAGSEEELRNLLDAAEDMKEGGTPLSELMQGRRLILVCYHLPVILSHDEATDTWAAKFNESLIARSEDSVADLGLETRWIGTVQIGDEASDETKEKVTTVLEAMNCHPIFVTTDMIEKAYIGYCKGILWPSFHNVDILDLTNSCWAPETDKTSPELTWDRSSTQNLFSAYKDLNQMFAQEVFNTSGPNDVIWIHDYHLMLVPKMVRQLELISLDDDAPETATGSDVGVAAGNLNEGRSSLHTAGGGRGLMHEYASGTEGYHRKQVFFLHIPFSTSQIFRSLQQGNELIAGMLHADVVGFHAFDHARHFLNACKRNMGLKFQSRTGGLLGVEVNGRTVMVVIRHVSIEVVTVDRHMKEQNPQAAANVLKASHPDKRLIAGLETCQRLSGVALKFLGFERLLDEYPTWANKLVLYQTCLRPNNRPEDEEVTSQELKELVKRINDKHGSDEFGPVVVYNEVEGSGLPPQDRMAIWLACDVLLNTTVREGLNLDCFEFVYVKEESAGVIVASEFGSTSSVLNGAIRTNPFDVDAIALSLDKALAMDDAEKANRRHRDLPYVTSRPSKMWTQLILTDMLSINSSSSPVLTHDRNTVPMAGPGRGKVLHEYSTGSGTGFEKLGAKKVVDAYKSTKNRVFILDYGGTLRENEALSKYIKSDINPCHKGRKLEQVVQESIEKLSADPANQIYVVSGLARSPLEAAFVDLPLVGLAASNGLCYTAHADEMLDGTGGLGSSGSLGSLSGGLGGGGSGGGSGGSAASAQEVRLRRMNMSSQQSGARDWFIFDYGVNWDLVKAIAMPILNRYTARTNGSSIRIRDPSVAWSYYRTDPEWGLMQARKLHTELEAVLLPHNVQVIHEKGELEIVPRQLHKGVVVKRVLQKRAQRTGTTPDFVFVIGDDASDEKMFSSVMSYAADVAGDPNTPPPPPLDGTKVSVDEEGAAEEEEQRLFMCTVGRKPSLAGHYLDNVSEVHDLLVALTTDTEAVNQAAMDAASAPGLAHRP